MMKKHIAQSLLLMVSALAFTACEVDEGTEPGGDSKPSVTIYSLSTTAPNDPDVDATFRVATNRKTAHLYYLAVPASDAASLSSDATIAEQATTKGTEVTLHTDTVGGGYVADAVVKDMVGKYNVYFVGTDANGNNPVVRAASFTGLEWINVAKGTYNFADRSQSCLGKPATQAATLQYLKTDPTRYRFKSLYGVGYSLVLNKTTSKGSDKYGDYTFYRVEAQNTPFSFSSYGTVSVRDIGYWQGDDSYAFSPSYGCFIYDTGATNTAVLNMQLFVSAGSLGMISEEFDPE